MAEAKPKLNNLQKHLIIQLLGAYYTINETLDILKEYYELELTYQAIHWYWKNRQVEILEARNNFDLQVEVIPITNKINRLKERQLLINDLKKNLWSEVAVYRDGKLMLDENGEPIAVKISPKHESINRILDSAKKELEPQSVKFSGSIGRHPIQDELDKLSDKHLFAIAEMSINEEKK